MATRQIYESGDNDPGRGTKKPNPQLIKVERDIQEVTIEGFRAVGVLSTFIAAAEAQCLSLTSDAEKFHQSTVHVINAFLLCGLLFSTFGAFTSMLAARWFSRLTGDELELLDHRWSRAHLGPSRQGASLRPGEIPEREGKYEYDADGDLPSKAIQQQIDECRNHQRNRFFARAVFSPTYFATIGFTSFIVGVVIYIWASQPLATAIIGTIITSLGILVVICLHLDFETMGVLNMMSFRRVRI
ncbi:hypothetical protein BDV93DRAFT_611159 [Ceratobasidium sp. AG-I]|nr:hypothetical protein BDV93DRAFT_611159 [Ceratobasidium sp. AG-I]